MIPPTRPGTYQPQLDGLRALAVLGVLFDHFALNLPAYLQYGTMSVRLFFVLTGYFMTMTLLRMRGQAEEAGVPRNRGVLVFYARRLLRIVPPLYIYLACAVFLGMGCVADSIFWHLSFLSNFYILDLGYYPIGTAHLWSLSVQEQFYVLWPWLILFTPRRWLPHVLVVVVLGALCYRIGCILAGADPMLRWLMLPGSLDAFAVGSLLGWWHRCVGNELLSGRRATITACGVIVLLMLARVLRYLPQDFWPIALIETFEAVFLTWLVLVVGRGVPGWVGRVLSWRPLTYIGGISYGIYLYHILVIHLAGTYLDPVPLSIPVRPPGQVAFLILASILAAMISWHLLEKPLQRIRPQVKRHAVSG